MLVDLVINPFGADLGQMVEMARVADEGGFGSIWVSDHFSGAVVDAPWSRDPFVCLGAMAAVTQRVDIGLLVGNITNRHPVQLASAANSLQSLSPGRVRLGVGSGSAPGSRFAAEHDMVGKKLAATPSRQQHLRDTIGALRAIWAGESDFHSEHVAFSDLDGVVDGAPMPPLIVGASAWSTIEVAIELANGVNVRRTSTLASHLDRLADHDLPDDFDLSVLDFFDPNRPEALLADAAEMIDLANGRVGRLIVTVWPARDLDAVRWVGAQRLT